MNKAKINVEELSELKHELNDDFTVIIARYKQAMEKVDLLIEHMELINGEI